MSDDTTPINEPVPQDDKPAPEATQSHEGEAKPADVSDQTEQTTSEDDQPKKQKTPEEREISRLRRRVDNLTRRLYQGQQAPQRARDLQSDANERDNRDEQRDDQQLSLSRKELQDLIDMRAREIAPLIKERESEIEHRRSVVTRLEKTWGREKFDALASDLDDALGGLQDANGRPTAAVDAIFEAKNAAALIEYLADPDHADEAESLSRMSPVRAAMKVAELSASLAQTAQAKPQASKASPPIEPIKAGGTSNSMPDPSDVKAWIRWRNEQEAKESGRR